MRWSSLTAAAAVIVVSTAAHAEGTTAKCTATEILASNDGKGVDAQLERFKPHLTKAPFASFNTFKLLGEVDVNAELHKPTTARLQFGALGLSYKDKVAVAAGKARMRIGLDLDDGAGQHKLSGVFTFESGETKYPLAGPPFRGGTYILAVTCTGQ